MKSKTLSKFLVLSALVFLITACDLKKSNPLVLAQLPGPGDGQGQGQGEVPVDQDQLITFSLLKRTTFSTCKDCHTKTKFTVLRTYADYTNLIEDIELAIAEKRMPPIKKGYAPLTTCEQALLAKWIELGAPEETNVKLYDLEACRPEGFVPLLILSAEPPPAVEEPVQTVTFEYLLKTSLVSCAECHTKTKDEQKKPLLTNIEQYKGRIADVMMTIENDEMPITDFGAALLSACEKAMLRHWVDAGAPAETTIEVPSIEECKVK